ncbi:MAG: hypothetical protein ACKO1I_19755 [Microcystis aeruginosa]
MCEPTGELYAGFRGGGWGGGVGGRREREGAGASSPVSFVEKDTPPARRAKQI